MYSGTACRAGLIHCAGFRIVRGHKFRRVLRRPQSLMPNELHAAHLLYTGSSCIVTWAKDSFSLTHCNLQTHALRPAIQGGPLRSHAVSIDTGLCSGTHIMLYSTVLLYAAADAVNMPYLLYPLVLNGTRGWHALQLSAPTFMAGFSVQQSKRG